AEDGIRDDLVTGVQTCALPISIFGGVMAFFWTVLWLGVTVLAMYFVGAAGIWCSVRSRDSWRSLVGTILWGYVGAGAVFLVTSQVGRGAWRGRGDVCGGGIGAG